MTTESVSSETIFQSAPPDALTTADPPNSPGPPNPLAQPDPPNAPGPVCTIHHAPANCSASHPVSTPSTAGSHRGCDRKSAPKHPYAAPAVPSSAAARSPAIVSASDDRYPAPA